MMRIRNVPPYIIVPGLIEAHKAGLSNITRDELEAHYLAGGPIVLSQIGAEKSNTYHTEIRYASTSFRPEQP